MGVIHNDKPFLYYKYVVYVVFETKQIPDGSIAALSL